LGFYPLTEKDKEEIEAYQKKQQEEKLQKLRENLNQD
jgi:hypothetical protein